MKWVAILTNSGLKGLYDNGKKIMTRKQNTVSSYSAKTNKGFHLPGQTS